MGVFTRIKRSWPYFLIGLPGIAILTLGIIFFHFWVFLRSPGSPNREVHRLLIRPGMSALSVANLLEERKVIADARLFYILCRATKSGNKIHAGEYDFLSLSTPEQVLNQMVQGRVVLRRIMIPEGSTVRDVSRALQLEELTSQEEIDRLLLDREFIGSLGLEASGLEGYLFPETYHFQKTQNTAAMLRTMVQQFWRRLPEGWKERQAELGLTLHQVVILASIIEKEAVIDQERPRIAAVFYNRLKQNIPLQSDPTAVYDLPDFKGPITWAHLRRQSPYNTYKNRGLPIGPICSPGEKSLRAAFYPEKSSYLYFVSNNDGSHHFSQTLAEHNAAVASYRKRRTLAPQREEEPALHESATAYGPGIFERIAPVKEEIGESADSSTSGSGEEKEW
jgi:UPF0755 protein